MKKIKIFLSLIAILFIAAGVFAKKANKEIAKDHFFTVGYYEFNGDATMTSERLDPSQYVYIGPNAPTGDCATGHDVLCGIKTEGDGVHPTIPASGDIHTALESNSPLPDKVFLHNE